MAEFEKKTALLTAISAMLINERKDADADKVSEIEDIVSTLRGILDDVKIAHTITGFVGSDAPEGIGDEAFSLS